MRLRWLISAVLLSAGACLAQSTTVTATITDTDGQTWNNGTVTATFVPGPTNAYKWRGGAIAPSVSGAMNGSGTFTLSLPDNSTITPIGSQWRFSICPNATAPCVSTTIAVSGASQNLSAQLSSVAQGPRFPATAWSFGYLDVEVYPIPLAGALYWNVTGQITRQWTGTAWQNLAGGSSSGDVLLNPSVTQTITQPTGTDFNVTSVGGNIAYTASSNITNAAGGEINNASGGETTNASGGGFTISNTDNSVGIQLNQNGTAPILIDSGAGGIDIDAGSDGPIDINTGGSLVIDAASALLNGYAICTTGTACVTGNYVQTNPAGNQTMNIPSKSNFAETNTNLGIASTVAHSITTNYLGQGFDLGNPWHTFNAFTMTELNLARGNNQMTTTTLNSYATGDSDLAYEVCNGYGGKLYYNDEGFNCRTQQMHQIALTYGPLATPTAGNISSSVDAAMGVGNTWIDPSGHLFPTTGAVASVSVYFAGTTTSQTAYIAIGTEGPNNTITFSGSQIVPVTIPAASGAHYQTFYSGSTLPSLSATAGQVLAWYQAAGESPSGSTYTPACLPASGIPTAGTFTYQTTTSACNVGIGFYGGIVIGATQAAPVAGATSIWISPANYYGYNDYNLGSPQFADGSIVFDQSQPVATATLGTTTGGGGTSPVLYSITSGTVPVSTAVGTLSGCTGGGTGETQTLSLVTCTVTLAATPAGGAFVSSGVLAISNFFGETALVTSVTALSAGTQTIAFMSTYPASVHNYETIGQGGLAGSAAVVTSTVGAWAIAWQVIASPTSTSAIIANCVTGTCFDVSNNAPTNTAVTFYPMTFVNGTANGISGSALLLPNAIPFTLGDTIVDAPTSEFSAQVNFEVFGQYSPIDYGQPSNMNFWYHDGPIGPVADIDIEDNTFNPPTASLYLIKSMAQYSTDFDLAKRPTTCFMCVPNQGSFGYATIFSDYNDGSISENGNTSFISSLPWQAPNIIATGAASTFAAGTTIGSILPCLQNGTDCPSSGMVYPGAGIPLSTGSAWGTSYSTSGSGSVALTSSPAFAGTPTAPTATTGTNTTQLATTAFVQNSVGGYFFQTSQSWSVQPALFSTSTMLSAVFLAGYTNTLLPTMAARLSGTISCTVAPVIQLMDLGTSPTTVYGSATSTISLTTGTSDGVYSVQGVIALTQSHWYGVAFSAGTCATAPTFDISVLATW